MRHRRITRGSRRRLPAWALLLVGALVLAACGTDDGADDGTDDGTDEPGAVEDTDDAAADPGTLEQVTVVLPSPPGIPHAPYFVAEELGYYAEEGLTVELVNVTGGQDANRVVASGQGHFAFPAASSVMAAVDQELPVVSVFTHRQAWIFGFSTLADSDIHEISDLAGRTVGVISESAATIANLMLVGAGMDPGTVDIEVVGGNMAGPLAAGQVDAIYSWNTLFEQFTRQGIEQRWIDSPEFDDYQSNVLLTAQDLVDDRPELVEGFLRGTAKGLVFTRESPDAAVDIVDAALPDLIDDRESALVELQIAIDEAESALSDEHGLGYHSSASWEQQQAAMLDLGLISDPPDPTVYWTNDFIDAANDFDRDAIADDARNHGN